MLLPIASLFGACGKDGGYNLYNLQNDFSKIEKENSNVILTDGGLTFDYSNHENINGIINSTSPYTSLKDYNYVFTNSMSFISSYIDECSNNDATKNATLKNRIKNDLDKLSLTIRDVNECFDLFAEALYGNMANPKAQPCLDRYENLIYTYQAMYVSAGNLTNSLADLYYNHVLNDGNPNVFGGGKANFNVATVVNKFESRIKLQLSNLTQCFVETYISGDLAEKVASGEKTFSLTTDNYKANITALSKPIKSIQTAIEKAEVNKNDFYELSVQAQNIQTTLKNDIDKFITACNDVDYVIAKTDATISSHDKMCVNIVESYYHLVLTYNEVLAKMLNIVTNA